MPTRSSSRPIGAPRPYMPSRQGGGRQQPSGRAYGGARRGRQACETVEGVRGGEAPSRVAPVDEPAAGKSRVAAPGPVRRRGLPGRYRAFGAPRSAGPAHHDRPGLRRPSREEIAVSTTTSERVRNGVEHPAALRDARPRQGAARARAVPVPSHQPLDRRRPQPHHDSGVLRGGPGRHLARRALRDRRRRAGRPRGHRHRREPRRAPPARPGRVRHDVARLRRGGAGRAPDRGRVRPSRATSTSTARWAPTPATATGSSASG